MMRSLAVGLPVAYSLLIAMLLPVWACKKEERPEPRESIERAHNERLAKLPKDLRPLLNARNVEFFDRGVSYQVTDCYPGRLTIQQILKQIPEEWQVRIQPDTDVEGDRREWPAMMVSRRNSPETPRAEELVHEWVQEWDTHEGVILKYHLEYRTPDPRLTAEQVAHNAAGGQKIYPPPSNCDLFVSAQHIRATTEP